MGQDVQELVPGRRLEELIHLAELCVDLLQQNEDHYAEVSISFLSLPDFFLPTPSSVLNIWNVSRVLKVPIG